MRRGGGQVCTLTLSLGPCTSRLCSGTSLHPGTQWLSGQRCSWWRLLAEGTLPSPGPPRSRQPRVAGGVPQAEHHLVSWPGWGWAWHWITVCLHQRLCIPSTSMPTTQLPCAPGGLVVPRSQVGPQRQQVDEPQSWECGPAWTREEKVAGKLVVLPAARREGALAVLPQLGEGSRLLSLEVLRARAEAKSLQLCLTAIPRTVARQASLSVGFSRQEDWSGLPCPPPGDLPNPGIEAGLVGYHLWGRTESDMTEAT